MLFARLTFIHVSFFFTVPAVSEIELIFYPRPHTENEADETRYIKTTDNATIQHLRKYLAMRMQLDLDKNEGSNIPVFLLFSLKMSKSQTLDLCRLPGPTF